MKSRIFVHYFEKDSEMRLVLCYSIGDCRQSGFEKEGRERCAESGVCNIGLDPAALPLRRAGYADALFHLAAVLLCTKKERHTGAAVAAALILDLLVCNVLLKPLVARPRPCTLNGALQLLMAAPSDYSFPSGHAAASFAAVGALRASKSRLWIPAFVLAVVICFSRLYLYHHWPSDVLAGAVLGTVLGYAGQQLSAAAARRLSTRRGH